MAPKTIDELWVITKEEFYEIKDIRIKNLYFLAFNGERISMSIKNSYNDHSSFKTKTINMKRSQLKIITKQIFDAELFEWFNVKRKLWIWQKTITLKILLLQMDGSYPLKKGITLHPKLSVLNQSYLKNIFNCDESGLQRSSNKRTHTATHRGSFKGNDCNDWLRSLIDKCTEMGVISPTFVIDNAPVHSKLESVIRIGEDAESCFKNEVKIKLRDKMPHIIAYKRINGVLICEYRMRILERIANEAIHVLTSLKLLHFSNHVERYYGAKNFHYTLKSLVPAPIKRNCITTLQKIFEYAKNLMRHVIDKNGKLLQSGGGSVMVCGPFSQKGKSKLAILNENQNSEDYIFTLSEFLLLFAHFHY
ncbi:hypothetical protein A3Q56_04520, partial [Intoshia linei]